MHTARLLAPSGVLALVVLALAVVGARAEWPQLRGNPERTGFIPEELQPPFRLAWVSDFEEERLGTALEPIVAGGQVFLGTHAGQLYALDARTGAPQWRFAARGPFLQSPACAGGRVIAACAGGGLYALDAPSGRLLWEQTPGAAAGFAASPLVDETRVWIGDRAGVFSSHDLGTGERRWSHRLGAPVRQSAALAGDLVVVTTEDLRVHAFEKLDGARRWRTEPLSGQTARDYAPVVIEREGRSRVVLRTNPAVNMAQRIARDRSLLARAAGADDSDWRKLDAWIKSEAARGTPELWAAEQRAILAHLHAHPDARTCAVLDGATGRELALPPVLWAAGCQGVGTPPVLTPDGRLLVLYRSAYGNWNHGVAPLVALGLWDADGNGIEPVFHDRGPQPPWNTFWGTADESQNFTVAGNLVFIVHQGTLSGLDLTRRHLFPILGERDTYGGFRNPAWARNEWHGPGRGGVAVAGGRVFWVTGSRVLCLEEGQAQPAPGIRTIRAADVPAAAASPAVPPDLAGELATAVTEMLEQRWAPLWVQPGLAGREFFFDHSSEAFAALAWAYPHLGAGQQSRVRDWLAAEWEAHPPFSAGGAYPLREGARREFCTVPGEELSAPAQGRPPHPLGHLGPVWLYATRVGETNRVLAAWPQLRQVFADWRRLGWRLDGLRGDLNANRYLGGLLACAHLARAAGDAEVAGQAQAEADEATTALVAWWRRAAAETGPGSFRGSGELDPFIGGGDALSFKVAAHRHKLALFRDLTPEVAARVRRGAPDAVTAVWHRFASLHATWWLVGEERQVHYGENFVDPPDLALGAFAAWAWLGQPPANALSLRIDLPFGRADLCRLTKLGLALDAAAVSSR